ncbi:MAG: T9SS type A sorting domain-containing protein, partial [Saprospiraceae bacterium]
GQLVMDEVYLNQMRDYLKVIHDEFAILYDVVGAEGFGMDIEYKVTAQDQLIIKQARPWVSFWANIKATNDLGVTAIVEPQSSANLSDSELVTAKIKNQGLKEMYDFDISFLVNNQLIETINITDTLNPQSDATYQFTVPQDFSAVGDYDITTIVSQANDGYSANDTLETVVSKLYLLEGGIITTEANTKCGSEIEITSLITNYGESTFNDTKIEVVVNGLAIDTITYDTGIPYLAEVELEFTITENLQPTNNEIILNLLSINGQQDDNSVNNSASIIMDLNSDFDIVTLKINADDYPEETSWEIYDELSNEVIASGSLTNSVIVYVKNVCIDYGSCLSLKVFDSVGDGICCGFGEGSFLLLSASGDTLITNDGNFGQVATEFFCPNEAGCAFTADIATTNASDEVATDGMITINPSAGFAPFQYSIDGGQTFVDENTFSDLAPGDYSIVIMDANEICSYEESITVEFDIVNDVDDISFNDIKVFPNPTNDNLIIEINETANISGTIQIEIYDYLGKLILTDSISKYGNKSKAIISLKDNPTGTYFAKCYNNTFEKFFKVIKL